MLLYSLVVALAVGQPVTTLPRLESPAPSNGVSEPGAQAPNGSSGNQDNGKDKDKENGNDKDKNGNDKDKEPEKDEPKKEPESGLLQKALQPTAVGAWLDANRIRVGGWTNGSFTGSTVTGNQLPYGFNYLGNEFLLQQNWLRIDRPVDRDAGEVDLGFRFDTILPGSDYRFTLARGLWDDQTGRYGIDPVQFYAELYLPEVAQGLSVKVGRFFAPYGVESIAAPDSPLGSRSYSFIYNPFTQTGVLANLKLSNEWSLKGGVVTGNDVFLDPASSTTFVGGFTWTPDRGETTVDFTTLLGDGRFDQRENFHNPQVFDVVVSRKLGEKTTWKLETLYGFTNDVPTLGYAHWFGITNYLIHEWDKKLSTTARLEFFDDIQGQRTGTRGLYTAGTVGVAYKPTEWLWLRPEVRLDHNDNRPFAGKATLFTATLDVIVNW